MTLELDQDGDTVSGTATFDGSPCWSVAMLDLVTADDRLSGTASAGDLSATLNATTTDDTMSGDFTVATGACSGAGTFTAQRE